MFYSIDFKLFMYLFHKQLLSTYSSWLNGFLYFLLFIFTKLYFLPLILTCSYLCHPRKHYFFIIGIQHLPQAPSCGLSYFYTKTGWYCVLFPLLLLMMAYILLVFVVTIPLHYILSLVIRIVPKWCLSI